MDNKVKKTRLQDFMEKYPRAMVQKGGIPDVCAAYLGYCDKNCETGVTCEKCWNTPVDE